MTDRNVEVTFQYSGTILVENYYLFSCRIKTDYTSGSMPRSILAAYHGTTGRWMTESGDLGGYSSEETDYRTMYQIIYVPEGCGSLMLRAHLPADTVATAYYDDFKLYRIEKDVLNAVLLSPAYKGYLFGESYGDIQLDVCVDENEGAYPLESLSLSVQLLAENGTVLRRSTPGVVTEKMNFVFSSVGLPLGTYYLQTVLYQNGVELARDEHILRKVAENAKPDQYIDKKGHLIQNGEKTFVKAIMNSNGNYLEVAQNLMETPIRKLSHYGRSWWAHTEAEQSDETKNALAYMQANGITIHAALTSYYLSNISNIETQTMVNQEAHIRPFLEAVATDYKDSPLLDSYYLFDEIEPDFYGDEIAWNQVILSAADPDHPTTGVADRRFDRYGVYNKMVDIVGIDPYPVSGTADESDISAVGKKMRSIKENFPNRPVYIVLQGFNWGSYNAVSDRSPNYAELRNMAYQALCEGAEGVDCFSYSAMQNDNSKTFEQWWQEIDTLYTEISGYEQVFLSDEPAPAYSVSGGGDWLNLLVKRHEGKTYLFAVNNQRTENAATVSIDGLAKQSLSFRGLEVKIMELDQAAYLSPEAELTSLGFFNCDRIFGVSDEAEPTIYVTDASRVINYIADISEDAKLFINGTEKPLRGKIFVSDGMRFTMKVLAADGTHSSTQTYRVVYQGE